jgi:hypothetical protein
MKMLNLPDTLDVYELMEVKGGILDKSQVCVLASAVKCTVAGSGVIVTKSNKPILD